MVNFWLVDVEHVVVVIILWLVHVEHIVVVVILWCWNVEIEPSVGFVIFGCPYVEIETRNIIRHLYWE